MPLAACLGRSALPALSWRDDLDFVGFGKLGALAGRGGDEAAIDRGRYLRIGETERLAKFVEAVCVGREMLTVDQNLQ